MGASPIKEVLLYNWGLNDRSSCTSEVVIADDPINHSYCSIAPQCNTNAPQCDCRRSIYSDPNVTQILRLITPTV
eukprot:831606-Heterocapsa_arctica.AAC.1